LQFLLVGCHVFIMFCDKHFYLVIVQNLFEIITRRTVVYIGRFTLHVFYYTNS